MTAPDPTAALPVSLPRGRVTRRGRDRGEQLLRVAADLFLARGYDNVTLDEIVALAGGPRPISIVTMAISRGFSAMWWNTSVMISWLPC